MPLYSSPWTIAIIETVGPSLAPQTIRTGIVISVPSYSSPTLTRPRALPPRSQETPKNSISTPAALAYVILGCRRLCQPECGGGSPTRDRAVWEILRRTQAEIHVAADT